VGLDVGLRSFIVDIDGNSVESPRFAENAAVKITGIQRRLPIAEKGSNNRRKLRDKLDKVHEMFSNQRADFLHKLSRTYANGYDIICVEDLDVKGLIEIGNSKGTPRNIHDASWSKFIFTLSYKAAKGWSKADICRPT
jgi:putative transposase